LELMAPAQRRSSVRKPACYIGWLVGDGGPTALRCYVEDVSTDGAKIRVFGGAPIPDVFTLHFTRGGTAQLRCKVVWRTPGAAGVEFVDAPARHGTDDADAGGTAPRVPATATGSSC
jgi:hypothetical protein